MESGHGRSGHASKPTENSLHIHGRPRYRGIFRFLMEIGHSAKQKKMKEFNKKRNAVKKFKIEKVLLGTISFVS